MTVLFLLINGPGRWSLDALFHEKRQSIQVHAGSKSLVLQNSPQPLSLYR
jgi:hypothetical protein